jgi:hypothetical protein
MTSYTQFTIEGDHVFTEEIFSYPQNVVLLCRHCGREWARADFGARLWNFITSPCGACNPKWGGSLYDVPDIAFRETLPRSILMREFKLELSRHELTL